MEDDWGFLAWDLERKADNVTSVFFVSAIKPRAEHMKERKYKSFLEKHALELAKTPVKLKALIEAEAK